MREFLGDPLPGADLLANRAFADWVLEDIRSAEPYPELAKASEDLARMASGVLSAAEQIVTVGFFGEYNTGKSLTLGTLVGNPLLLPVQSEPATANITRLRLVQGGDDRPAEVTAAYAEFIRPDELPGYIAAIIYQVADRIRKLGGRSEADEIEAMGSSPDALPGLATLLERLAVSSSAAALMAREVREFDAALQASPLLGEQVPLDAANPWRLVAYGSGDLEAQSGPNPRDYRPLVRQVVLDVSVPVWAWNLQSLRGAKLHLIDIPGLGGQSFRDSYVGRQELEKVTAALAVVSATRASAADSWQYVDQLARRGGRDELYRRLMFAATRFDSLEGLPGTLLDDTGQTRLTRPVSEEEFLGLDQVSSIRILVSQIRSRVHDRFAFVSPLVAIGRTTPAADVRWSRDEVIQRLPISRQDVNDAVDRADGWAKVGVPDGTVGFALKDFWTDGGMERLRATLTRYVLEDGLDAHADDVAVRAEALRREHARFREQLAACELARSPRVRVRQSRQDARASLRRYVDGLRLAAARELRDPRQPPADGAPSLWDLLEQQCAHLVRSWPQWQLLFGAVRGNLVVVPRDALVQAAPQVETTVPDSVPPEEPGLPWQGPDDDWISRWDPENLPRDHPEAPPPVMADDLLEPFLRSCADLRGLIRQLVDGHVETWCRNRSRAVADERKIMDDWLMPLANQGNAAVQRFYAPILYVTDPDRTMTTLRRRMEAVPVPNEKEAAESFPLDPARALPWHPDSPRRDHVDLSGPAQVQRIRRELVAALVREGSGFVRLLLEAAASGIDRVAGQAREQLVNRNVLAEIVAAELGSDGDSR
jgi:Dynamin family